MDKVKDILEFGKKARGRTERIRTLQGEKLTRNAAILAHCYDCQGGYCDGVSDCEASTCSLYRYHPYKTIREG